MPVQSSHLPRSQRGATVLRQVQLRQIQRSRSIRPNIHVVGSSRPRGLHRAGEPHTPFETCSNPRPGLPQRSDICMTSIGHRVPACHRSQSLGAPAMSMDLLRIGPSIWSSTRRRRHSVDGAAPAPPTRHLCLGAQLICTDRFPLSLPCVLGLEPSPLCRRGPWSALRLPPILRRARTHRHLQT